MFKVAIGHSNDPDSQTAIDEVLEMCYNLLTGQKPQAGVLFAATGFEHALILDRIQQRFPSIELIGGTTNGEMSSVLGFQQDSLTLMVFCSNEIEIKAGIGRGASKNPKLAAQEAIHQAKARITSDIKLCLTFPDSLTSSGVSILSGLRQSLGEQVTIVGGMAADDYVFQRTYQFYQNEVLSDSVPVLLFGGKLCLSHGVASGWQPIGKKSRVTKVDGNIVYKIDNQSALDFYQSYLGVDTFASEYAIYSLAIFESNQENFYMRAPSNYDEKAGSITFFSDIPSGAIVQITEASCNDILAASQTSLMQAVETYSGVEPAAALLISCSARRRILGTRAKEEYQLLKQYLPETLPCCGFYAYGEIAPLEYQSPSRFHNKTFVTLLLGM